MAGIIPYRYASLVFSILMAFSMSVPISAVMLIAHGGLELGWGEYLLAWLRSAALGFVVAIPIASFVSSPIRVMTAWLTDGEWE